MRTTASNSIGSLPAGDWSLGAAGERFEVEVQGDPSVLLTFKGLQPESVEAGLVRNEGVVATAMHCVNAIPLVCEAEPGIKTYLDLPVVTGRAAPALASLDKGKRVIHIGTFSKTVSPGLRLGFIVAPAGLVEAFSEAAAVFAPAPSPVIQLATAQFMREGHYSRRVRRLKRLYSAQRDALCEQLRMHDAQWVTAGLAVLLSLPDRQRAAAAR